MDKIKELYSSHGFPGAARLYSIAKAKGVSGFTLKDIQNFISEQTVHQLHKPEPKEVHETPITASDVNMDFQADLADYSSYAKNNDGNAWLLVVIDIFDRKLACVPQKNKEATTTLAGLKEAFRQLGNPRRVVSDSGSEFKGAVDKFLTQHHMAHYKVEPGDHNVLGLVDRVMQTMKNMIQRTITATGSTRWIDALPNLVKNYNDTPHSGLGGQSPDEAAVNITETRDLAFAKKERSKEVKEKSKVQLNVGDQVRIGKEKGVFGKGYEQRWSIKVYTIEKVDGLYYILDDGKRVRGHRLQKVRVPKVEEVEERKEVEVEPNRNIAKEEKFEHRTDQILKFKEGVSQSNRRAGLRERKPEAQVEDVRYGKIRWT